MRRRLASLAMGLAVLAAACTDEGRDEPRATEAGRVECEVGFAPPPGFQLQSTIHRSAPDHVGIRRTYDDSAGRVLHFFSGIAGEFGEGMQVAGSYSVANGVEARLLGSEPNWVLVWETSGPCATQAVIGNGFSRMEFLAVLEASGVLAPA